MADGFSVSKDSIQIPYSRFLTESAAGLMLLLFALAAYYRPLVTPAPLKSLPLFSAGAPLTTEVRVFVLLIAFLLATPIGYAINGFSWTILTQVLVAIETLCYRRAVAGAAAFFPANYVSTARHVPQLAKQFGIHDDINFSAYSWFFRSVLEHPNLARLKPETHVRGLTILLRNCAFFALLGSFICLYNVPSKPQLRPYVIAVVVLVLLSLILTWQDARAWRKATLTGSIPAAAFGYSIIVWISLPDPFAVRALLLLLAAVLLVVIAGVVGYYNCAWAILHMHLSAAALGATTIASSAEVRDKPLGVATAIVAHAGTKSLGSGARPQPG